MSNLIYYRFLNPAIVAPDAFDIIDLQVGDSYLQQDARRNLGCIARCLQAAAAAQQLEGTRYFCGNAEIAGK